VRANATAVGVALVGMAVAGSPGQVFGREKVALTRLCLLIHPMCYRGRGAELIAGGMSAEAFDAYCRVEDRVEARWRRDIRRLRHDGVLVILPHGDTPAERDLHEFALQTLGPRCVILRRGMPWDGAFWEGLGEDFMVRLGEELKAAVSGGVPLNTWDAQVSVATMAYARDIRAALAERGFTLDPATVRAEAWGESFEGCVFMYSVRLRAYLGLTDAVEDRFDMTVPDALFLTDSRLLDAVSIPGDVRLYLWEGADGRPIAALFETSQPLRRPRRFATVPAGALNVQVTDKNRNPIADTIAEGGIHVPLQEAFIFGEPGSLDALRSALLRAQITP
jgi:hypothetical protein